MDSEKILPESTISALLEHFTCTTRFDYNSLVIETEGKAYNACHFTLEDKMICFRKAKITPTKTGQFVTLWKRNSNKIIAPFDRSDTIDFVVVLVADKNEVGHFIFPSEILFEKGIFSTEIKEGKRAIRIYPPWDFANSKQAIETQKWQLEFFKSLC